MVLLEELERLVSIRRPPGIAYDSGRRIWNNDAQERHSYLDSKGACGMVDVPAKTEAAPSKINNHVNISNRAYRSSVCVLAIVACGHDHLWVHTQIIVLHFLK